MSKRIEFLFDVGSRPPIWPGRNFPQSPAKEGAVARHGSDASGRRLPGYGERLAGHRCREGPILHDRLRPLREALRRALRYNPHFPINTLGLMRMLTGAKMRLPDQFADLLAVVFAPCGWTARISTIAAVVGRVLTGAGHDATALLTVAGDQEVKDRLRANTETAVQRGVFGAPTCFVGDEMFFGQDRLDFVREALRA